MGKSTFDLGMSRVVRGSGGGLEEKGAGKSRFVIHGQIIGFSV
jgi:hypothetical protein